MVYQSKSMGTLQLWGISFVVNVKMLRNLNTMKLTCITKVDFDILTVGHRVCTICCSYINAHKMIPLYYNLWGGGDALQIILMMLHFLKYNEMDMQHLCSH